MRLETPVGCRGCRKLAADEYTDTAGFLESIADTVRHHIQCEAVSIFLVSRGGERLEARYARQSPCGGRSRLPENERCYRAAELMHPTVRAWQECRIILTGLRHDGRP